MKGGLKEREREKKILSVKTLRPIPFSLTFWATPPNSHVNKNECDRRIPI